MRPHEIWLHISPRHPSDSLRGWHFPKDEPRPSRRQLITRAWIVGLVVVCGVVAICLNNPF